MSFGEKLAKLRKEKGMSQEELAQELNVSRQAVSKWESNSSYPETEKIVQICKLFNSSMDELIGLKNSKVKEENEFINTINNYIDSFVKGIKMFYSMTFIQKLKCLMEMFFYVVIIVVLFAIIHFILISVIYNLLSILPYEIMHHLVDTFEGILLLVYFIVGIYLLVKLYKIRYLDYYEDIKPNIIIKEEKVVTDNKSEKMNIKEEKIIIRDSQNSFNPFSSIKTMFIIIGKIMLTFIAVPIAIMFVFLLATIIFILYFINKGIILFYIVLGLFGGLLVLYILLEIFIRLILSMNLKPKRLLIMAIASLLIMGISAGLFACELSTYKITENNSYEDLAKTVNIEMNNNLLLHYLDWQNTEIVYETRDDILVEFYVLNNDFIDVISYDNYNDYYYFETFNENDRFHVYSFWTDYSFHDTSFKSFIDLLLECVKNKELVYDKYDAKAVIHVSNENYNILINNMNKYNNY